MKNGATPFVKWAGGKKQLLDKLTKDLPDFKTYHEPFVGGGALFFKLYALEKIKTAYLNDSTSVLINAYEVIKTDVEKLINELQSPKYQNNKTTYYKIRADEPQDKIKRVARFLYLNKTAFNGLYRVNSKGGFNVPFGKYKNPKICDEENLRFVSKALKKAKLLNEDFKVVLKYARKGSFVYLDPPYFPLSGKPSFTSYTPNNFSKEDHDRLYEVFKKLDSRGCHVMLSNSYNPYTEGLYHEFKLEIVHATRMISCKAAGRGKIREILVRNW